MFIILFLLSASSFSPIAKANEYVPAFQVATAKENKNQLEESVREDLNHLKVLFNRQDKSLALAVISEEIKEDI